MLQQLYRRIALGSLFVAFFAGAVVLWFTLWTNKQVRELTDGAQRFSAGDFTVKLPPLRVYEFNFIGQSLNAMAERLNEEVHKLTHERNEREAILGSMIEGVFAVDREERVLTMNEAAARLLDVERDAAVGRSIQEVVRNPELQRTVADTLAGDGPVEREIVLRVCDEERVLQTNGVLLHRPDSSTYGAVVVLNDVTRLKRLEAVRSDFVANVSHELKTPVTSIKGFTETLLDGAVEDAATARRFLTIVAGQADRLNAIVDDLLSLSTLEAVETKPPAMSEGDVRTIAHVAAEVCSVKAAARDINLRVRVPEMPTVVLINPPLIEQAIINLVDNAVKYSPDGSEVEVMIVETPAEVQVIVRDYGLGVEREHLSRLFERFFRVDKARSRDLGGTGLGLAIVKHVMQLHGGRVSVESELGRGSTFTLHIPKSSAKDSLS